MGTLSTSHNDSSASMPNVQQVCQMSHGISMRNIVLEYFLLTFGFQGSKMLEQTTYVAIILGLLRNYPYIFLAVFGSHPGFSLPIFGESKFHHWMSKFFISALHGISWNVFLAPIYLFILVFHQWNRIEFCFWLFQFVFWNLIKRTVWFLRFLHIWS